MKRGYLFLALSVPIMTGCTFSINVGANPTSAGIPRCSAATTQGRDESRSGLLLMAQSARTASLLPCLRALPVGWTFERLEATNKRARFWLDSDRAGQKAVRVSLSAHCVIKRATESASSRTGVRRYDRVETVHAGYRSERYLVFAGGCIDYHFNLHGPGSQQEASAVSGVLDVVTRADLARSVHDYSHGRLELDPPSSRPRSH